MGIQIAKLVSSNYTYLVHYVRVLVRATVIIYEAFFC
jgi:hypothetical protein